eukprot:5043858-Karenia_brevis.AAC.1
MEAEREKAGLLPGRPVDDGLHDCTNMIDGREDSVASARNRRRPADIFIPQALGGVPTALDFACTSGMRADNLREAIDNPDSILMQYDAFKKDFQAAGETETTEAL